MTSGLAPNLVGPKASARASNSLTVVLFNTSVSFFTCSRRNTTFQEGTQTTQVYSDEHGATLRSVPWPLLPDAVPVILHFWQFHCGTSRVTSWVDLPKDLRRPCGPLDWRKLIAWVVGPSGSPRAPEQTLLSPLPPFRVAAREARSPSSRQERCYHTAGRMGPSGRLSHSTWCAGLSSLE